MQVPQIVGPALGPPEDGLLTYGGTHVMNAD